MANWEIFNVTYKYFVIIQLTWLHLRRNNLKVCTLLICFNRFLFYSFVLSSHGAAGTKRGDNITSFVPSVSFSSHLHSELPHLTCSCWFWRQFQCLSSDRSFLYHVIWKLVSVWEGKNSLSNQHEDNKNTEKTTEKKPLVKSNTITAIGKLKTHKYFSVFVS